jgi:hypothetical protein
LPCENTNIKIYRRRILPGVLYGYKTWAVSLNKENRLNVFENMVLRRIFRPKEKKTQDRENI